MVGDEIVKQSNVFNYFDARTISNRPIDLT